ncbi:hypothetical protein VS868_11935 [Salinimicrobium sp. 3283s]|uniref:hypothetical protein n=1 Tax=Salinimicrobium sp. 3283s TaxID=3114359 RepID=UPI0031E60FC2
MEQEVKTYDELKAYRRRNTLRANISRDNAKLKKMPEGPTKVKFLQKLEQYELEKEIIERNFDFKRSK